MVRVELARLIINERTDEQVIFLREADGSREFPIVIGMFEAFAIDRIVKERPSERPLTQDLLASMVELLDARVARTVIDDLRDDTYYAKVVLKRENKEEVAIDSRPSDAIIVALKASAPIYVAEKVMNGVSPQSSRRRRTRQDSNLRRLSPLPFSKRVQ
jgi:bifunctional DNase/RNase